MSTILTVTEAADRLRRSERFVLDELRRKNLRGSKYGGAWSITEDDLDAYREAHANVSRVRRAS
jgi:excisionase family DNA binding protein